MTKPKWLSSLTDIPFMVLGGLRYSTRAYGQRVYFHIPPEKTSKAVYHLLNLHGLVCILQYMYVHCFLNCLTNDPHVL